MFKFLKKIFGTKPKPKIQREKKVYGMNQRQNVLYGRTDGSEYIKEEIKDATSK
jgi:hypothetical protein